MHYRHYSWQKFFPIRFSPFTKILHLWCLRKQNYAQSIRALHLHVDSCI